jgi:lysyl-tRNA synthetase class 2
MLAKSLHPLPAKWHGLKDVEIRYRQRYLDLIANEEVRQLFVTRTRTVTAMRRFLDGRGFMEVETPILQPLYGGATARPFETDHHALDQTLYLRISDELYLKRLIIGGYERVYEIGKDFRNEGLSTRHNPEFTMMECYQAYADYHDMMTLTEEMIACIAQEVTGSAQITYQGHEISLTPPWRRITMRQALFDETAIDIEAHSSLERLRQAIAERGLRVDPTPTWGKQVDELFSEYVEPRLIQPTFILDYPVELSPLAKKKPDAPHLVERFEPFVGGLEMGNAFSELNDPLDQRARFVELAKGREMGDEEVHPIDEDFVTALMYGMPPTGGLGIGVDRLMMLLTDRASIREVILFPQLRTRG